MQNRIFLDPLLRGGYPQDVLDHLDGLVDLAHVLPGDEQTIAAPLDFLGVNYYRPGRIGARCEPGGTWTVWPGDERVEFVPQDVPSTAMGWPVDATGLTELLVRLHEEYDVPIVVTE